MMKKIKEMLLKLTDDQEWIELEDLLLSSNQTDIININCMTVQQNCNTQWLKVLSLKLFLFTLNRNNYGKNYVPQIIKKYLFSKQGPHLLNGILKSLQCKTRESTSLKYKIYESVLSLIKCNEDTDEKENGKLVTVLIMHVDSFPSNIFINLINSYMDYLSSGLSFYGRWTDFLSKLLLTSISRKDLIIEGKAMSGEDFQYHILKTLCGYKWSAQTTTTLLPILKELSLPKEELKDVTDKLRKVLSEVEYQSVPPIVYHMILLGQASVPGTILEVVMQFFNDQEASLRKEKESEDSEGICDAEDSERIEQNTIADLIEAQGTVILHITQLAQYDSHLVKDYLKVIKCTWLPRRLFTPFNLALALSLAPIDRYKDQIIDSLKSCILKHFKQEEKRQKSLWFSEAFKSPLNITEVFRTTVSNCKGGWDQMSESLVFLCFSLLESGGGMRGETFPCQQTVSLASTVLPLIFKREPRLAPNIIKQLSTFILTAATSIQYVELLGRLVKVSPLVLLDHVNLVRDLLEQLAFLPLPVATLLLSALLPLVKMSMTLKDALVILLRKLLFSKQIENREVAVRGFLQILRHFRVLGALPSSQASMSFSSTLSQISADVHTAIDNSTNEALCLELLGVLRRCFTQQSEVRATLYMGLYDVSRTNPKLATNILQLLHRHLSSFIDSSADTLNPILLRKTVSVQGESVTLIEPLGELLSCLSRCKTQYEKNRNERDDEEDNEDEVISTLNEICSTFDVLTEKLAYCDMDDLDFGGASFVAGTVSGKQNLYYAEIMSGVFDALMDQNFCNGALESEDKMKTFLALFKTQKRIVDLVKEKSKPGKKGEGSKTKGKAPNVKQTISFKSILSLEIAIRILKISLSGDESANRRCVELIEGNCDLQIYLISIVNQTISSLKTMPPSNREKILPDLKSAGHLLLKECWTSFANEFDKDDEREITRIRHCLTTLHSLMVSFVKYYKDKLPQIFRDLTGKSPAKEYESLLFHVAKSCCKITLKILRNTDQSSFMKDAPLLIQITGLVAQQMDQNSKRLVEVQDLVNQICEDQPVSNASVAESLVQLLLAVTDRVKLSSNIVRSIAREIHFRMGDIEQDVVVEECGNYKIVTESSASSILAALCSYCDKVFSILELTMNKLKASLIAGEKYNEEQFDKMISMKFVVTVQALHEVFQSAIPQGPPQDLVLRTTTKFYNCMSMYVKYYLEYYRVRNNPQISEKFEKLIHLCGNMLKENAFRMISYIHNTQLQTGKKKKQQGSLTARALKESKLIPALVFAMEQYEKHLVQLTKKSKVNLLAGTKITTSRDFRINADTLQDAMQRTEEEGEESEDEQDEIEEEGREEETDGQREKSPPLKKRKNK